MSDSFLSMLPTVELGEVKYSPRPIPHDPSYGPKVRVVLGEHGGFTLSLSIADARALREGLDAALAEHDQATAVPLLLVKAVA